MAVRPGLERLEGRALLAADDFGDSLLAAFPVALDGTGSGRVTGEIEEDLDIDTFRFVPPVDGLVTVRMEKAPGGVLDTYLRIDDENGDLVTLNDDVVFGFNRNSRVRFIGRAGQTYYVRAQSSGGTSGRYAVTFEGPRPIAPAAAGPTRLAGTIEEGSDLDLYRFVAPATGVLEARLERAPGSLLDGALTVFDVDDRGTIGAQADDDDGARDGVVRFAAVAGRVYDVEASAFQAASIGDYTLTLLPPALADPPSDLAGARPIELPPSGPAVVPASVDVAGDVDAFRFVAPRTGGVTIRLDATLGSGLDSTLDVFGLHDGGTIVRLAGNDDSRASRNSLVRLPAIAGHSYFLQAGGYGGTIGPYTLTITPDDFGDDLDSAYPLALAGPLVQPGTIDADGDVDVFSFVAPMTGRVTLRQEAAPRSDLDSFVTVFDGARRPIAFVDDGGNPLAPKDSVVRFGVQQGQTYFVRAGAFPNVSGTGGHGDYLLRLDPGLAGPADDHGDTLVDASPITLDAGFARPVGTIDTPGDVDVFRVVAPAAGTLLARQDPTAGSTLQAILSVFDGSGRLIATDFDSSVLRGRSGSALQWDVEAGREYVIQAAGFRGTIGGYDLSVFAGDPTTQAADDFGAGLTAAPLIRLDANGSGGQAGTIDTPGDVDAFRFVAPATGLLRVGLEAVPGSRLDPFLFGFDDSGSPLGQNDDVDGPTDRNSSLLLGTAAYPVVAGKTYSLKAAGFGPSTGRYQLTIALLRDLDRPGRVFDDARDTLPLDPNDQDFRTIEAVPGTVGQAGSIDVIGDVDTFRVLARASGTLTVRQSAAGSGLDSVLRAFDGFGHKLDENNDDKGTRDSSVQIVVTAGRVYYLQAGAFGGFTATGPNIGRYVLSLALSDPAPAGDVGDTFATAAALTLPASGSLDLAGAIEIPLDVDVFRFQAPLTGTLTIRQDAGQGSGPDSLDSFLAVFDGAGHPIDSDDDTAGSLGSLVQLDVQQGREYFVRAAGFGASTGRYLLHIRPGASAPLGIRESFDGARPVDIDEKRLTATVFGSIDFAGGDDGTADADVFQFVAPVAGPLMIRQEWTAGSRLDSLLFVFDDQRRLIASNDDNGTLPDAAVVVNLARGQTFYVRATSSSRRPGPDRRPTGAYRLVVSPLADDFGDAFTDTRAIVSDGRRLVDQAGTIEVAGDADLFEFVAPATGRLPIRLLSSAPGSGLDPILVAFDEARAEIARDDDITPGVDLNSRVQLDVTEGRRYFLRASGYGTTAGPYRLAFGAIAADDHGSDSASATPLPLSAAGSGELSGTIEDAEDVDVFRLEAAPDDRRLVVELTPAAGRSLVADLRVFTVLDGIRTQVASQRAGSRVVPFDADRGRTYFLRVAPVGGSIGGYRLAIGTDAVAVPSVSIREAGKGTFDQLRESFLRDVPRIGPATDEAQRAADAISADLVRRFRAGLDGRLTTSYLLLWLDPVDFRTTDPQLRQAGYTAEQGAINEQGGGYYSGTGVLQLLIVPRAIVGHYSVELIGLGPDPVLFGARLIGADGTVSVPSISYQGRGPVVLPVNPSLKEGLVVILDFSTPQSPAGSPQGSGRPGTSGANQPPGHPAGSAGSASDSGPSAPDRTIIAGIVAALQSQARAGEDPAPGSPGSVASGAVVLTVVPMRFVPTGSTTPNRARVSGAAGTEPSAPGARTPPGQLLSTLFRSLWDASEPLRTTLRDAWEALRGTLSAYLPWGGSPASTAEKSEAIEGSRGQVVPPRGRTRPIVAEDERVVAAPAGVEGTAGPASARDGPYAPADAQGGCELVSGTRVSVAIWVVASSLGIIPIHRAGGRPKGRARFRKGGERRPPPRR
jgi:hypothetical protein